MKYRLHLSRLAFAIAWGLLLLPAMGADAVRVGAYDFSYAATGDERARPVQVFDDGRSTFFQFRAGDAVPAIFSGKQGDLQLVVPVQEGPYVRVAELHGRFILQSGRSQAQVFHSAGVRPDAPPLTAVSPSGMATPYSGGAVSNGSQVVASLAPAASLTDDAIYRNSYASPSKGDRVVWTEGEPRRDERIVWFKRGSAVMSAAAQRTVAEAASAKSTKARFVVIGRDDDTYKEGLDRLRAAAIRDALLKAGVSADQISSRGGIAADKRNGLWASNLTVEIERPAAAGADGARATRSSVISANLESLVRAGVLRHDQAQAILTHHASGVGVPMTQASEVQPAPTAVATVPQRTPSVWEVRSADQTVQKMLERWAAQAGWQLIWKDGPQIPLTGNAQIARKEFLEAATYVVAQARGAGYRLKATAYSNQTMVIESE